MKSTHLILNYTLICFHEKKSNYLQAQDRVVRLKAKHTLVSWVSWTSLMMENLLNYQTMTTKTMWTSDSLMNHYASLNLEKKAKQMFWSKKAWILSLRVAFFTHFYNSPTDSLQDKLLSALPDLCLNRTNWLIPKNQNNKFIKPYRDVEFIKIHTSKFWLERLTRQTRLVVFI